MAATLSQRQSDPRTFELPSFASSSAADRLTDMKAEGLVFSSS